MDPSAVQNGLKSGKKTFNTYIYINIYIYIYFFFFGGWELMNLRGYMVEDYSDALITLVCV